MSEQTSKMLSFRASTALAKAVKMAALKRDVSLQSWMRRVVTNGLELEREREETGAD